MAERLNLCGRRTGPELQGPDAIVRLDLYEGHIADVRISHTERYTEDFVPEFHLAGDEHTLVLVRFTAEGTELSGSLHATQVGEMEVELWW